MRIEYKKLRKDLKIEAIEQDKGFTKTIKRFGLTPQALYTKTNNSYGTKEFIDKLRKLCKDLGIELEDYIKDDDLTELFKEHKQIVGDQMYYYYKKKYNNRIPTKALLNKHK